MFEKHEILIEHNEKVHKKYSCKECCKEFTEEKVYIEHIQLHSNIERFQCNICNEIYLKKEDLQNHGQSHEGQEFGCETCAAKFLSTKDLKDHIASQHTKVMYNCKSCTNMYDDKIILEQHIIREHKEGINQQCTKCDKS